MRCNAMMRPNAHTADKHVCTSRTSRTRSEHSHVQTPTHARARKLQHMTHRSAGVRNQQHRRHIVQECRHRPMHAERQEALRCVHSAHSKHILYYTHMLHIFISTCVALWLATRSQHRCCGRRRRGGARVVAWLKLKRMHSGIYYIVGAGWHMRTARN